MVHCDSNDTRGHYDPAGYDVTKPPGFVCEPNVFAPPVNSSKLGLKVTF